MALGDHTRKRLEMEGKEGSRSDLVAEPTVEGLLGMMDALTIENRTLRQTVEHLKGQLTAQADLTAEAQKAAERAVALSERLSALLLASTEIEPETDTEGPLSEDEVEEAPPGYPYIGA